MPFLTSGLQHGPKNVFTAGLKSTSGVESINSVVRRVVQANTNSTLTQLFESLDKYLCGQVHACHEVGAQPSPASKVATHNSRHCWKLSGRIVHRKHSIKPWSFATRHLLFEINLVRNLMSNRNWAALDLQPFAPGLK
jgi:hypothetical protein